MGSHAHVNSGSMIPEKQEKQHLCPEVPSLRLLPKVDRYEPNAL